MNKLVKIFSIALLFAHQTAFADDIHVKIAPNPASAQTEIHISNAADGQAKLEIYNVLGTLIQTSEITLGAGSNSIVLNISTLAEGIYLVRVAQNGESCVKRLKVQHSD
jgi:hypothetical protein